MATFLEIKPSSKFDMLAVGGKAFNLIKLVNNEIDIPKTFVLDSSEFEKFKNQEHIRPLLENISFDNLFDVSEKLHNIFTIEEVRKVAIDASAIQRSLSTVAVRSSANVEDSKEASFAGQFESVLNVDINNPELFLMAIKEVWQSTFSPRALAYSIANGVSIPDIEMAVIVQEMIDAEFAGTSFTKDIENGDRSIITIQATEGIGDVIVDGTADETTYKVNKDSKHITTSGAKLLSDVQISNLTEISKKIEHMFGAEQDIEWAFDKEDKLWILQTRAITT